MSDLKELLSKGAVKPSTDIAAPIVFVNKEVDKHGVRFDIPPIPVGFFSPGEDKLMCILGLSIPGNGHTDLDVSGGNGPVFYVHEDRAKHISTDSGAFEDALHKIGNGGIHDGIVEVFYAFYDKARRKEIYSPAVQLMVHFPAGDSTNG